MTYSDRSAGISGQDACLVLARELIIHAPPIAIDSLCLKAFAYLTENAEWPGLCVVDKQGKICGLVSRRHCLTILAKPLMLDLYSKRSVERIMHVEPLVVDVADTIDAIAERIADDAPEALIDGFIVAENGRYMGVATAQDLLVRSVEQSRRRSIAVEEARRAAEEANLAKSSFLANLSHEIRTPLNGVLANLELLSTTSVDAEQTELVGAASVAAQALFEIIGDVLDLSKIEAGKLTIESIAFDPASVARDIALLAAPQAAQRDLHFACHIEPAAWFSSFGDPTRLRQIVMNMVSNALKFTKSGGIYLNLFRMEGEGGGPAELWFEVSDTGVGFASEKAEKLFEAFTQEDESTTRKFGGTGLGLSICRALAEMMGGSIHADGARNEGASFWCRIPFDATAAVRIDIPSLADVKVMVVFPDGPRRERLTGNLISAGMTVIGIAKAADAEAVIRQAAADGRPIDAVLVAIDDEKPDVMALPARIRDLVTVPVMLVGRENPGGRRAGYRAGYRYLAALPCRPHDITWAVAAAIGRVRTVGGASTRIDLAALQRSLAGVAGARLLVIDDNHMNRQVAQRQLTKLGFTCKLAEDGRQGLAMVMAERFDLVFCDVQMPEMDGHAFTRALRAWEQEHRRPHLAVVAMTANAMQGDVEKCHAAGMDDYVSKPVKIESMGSALSRWLLGDSVGEIPADLPTPTASPPVDFAALSDILGDDSPETHAEVLALFQECYPPLAEAVTSAISAQDLIATRRAAHTAKGAASNASAAALAKALWEIEHIPDDCDWDKVRRLAGEADRLGTELERFIQDWTANQLPGGIAIQMAVGE